jgi:hypothetical protein
VLQHALINEENVKVRIAAAQAIARVPSRMAFRVPETPGVSDAWLEAGKPSYDAYPAVFTHLLNALQLSVTDIGFFERKYRDGLQMAVRTALLKCLLLSEKADYGLMKETLDEASMFLLQWLMAEKRAILTPCSELPPTLVSGIPEDNNRFSVVLMLKPVETITLPIVQTAFKTLATLFSTRIKTVPASIYDICVRESASIG